MRPIHLAEVGHPTVCGAALAATGASRVATAVAWLHTGDSAMPFVLLVKETRTGDTSHPNWEYRVLAVMPCCGYQKRAQPEYFTVFGGRRGELRVYPKDRLATINHLIDYSKLPSPQRRCNKCHRFLRLHILTRKDETWRICGHGLSNYLSNGYTCDFKALPGKKHCGIHTKYEERHI